MRADPGKAMLGVGVRLQERAAAGVGEPHVGAGDGDLFDQRPEHDAAEMGEGRHHRGENDHAIPVHRITRGSGSGTMNEPR